MEKRNRRGGENMSKNINELNYGLTNQEMQELTENATLIICEGGSEGDAG